jgi:hypothetical protein
MYRYVATDIFGRHFAATPPVITPQIEAFCQSVKPGGEPHYLQIEPTRNATPLECYYNVLREIDAGGGELVFGWAIFEWPGVYLEAEHHGVLKRGGRLIDITPRIFPAERILFIPDPGSAFDFNDGRPVVTRMLPMGHRLGAKYVELLETHQLSMRTSGGANYRLNGVEVTQEIRVLRNQIGKVLQEILIEQANSRLPDAPCLCVSGRRFSACCQRYFA